MTRIKLLIFAFALLIVQKTYAKSDALKLTSEQKEWIKNNPKIKVHNEATWAPFNFNVGGAPTGYSIDYMNLLAEKTGLEIEYISGHTWSEFLDLIKNKELDAMLNIVKTENRSQYIKFTDSYIRTVTGIFIQNGRKEIKSLNDLDGKKLAITEGFFQHELVEKYYPNINLHLVKNNLDALYAVQNNEAYAALGEISVSEHLIASHGLVALKNSGRITDKRFDNILRIGVRDNAPQLQEILNQAIKSVTLTEKKVLYDKWLSGSSTFKKEEDLNFSTFVTKEIVTIAFVVILLVLLAIRLYRVLEKSNNDPLYYQLSTPAGKRLLASFNILWFLLMSIFCFWGIESIQIKNRKNIEDSLSTILQTTKEALIKWSNSNKKQIQIIGNNFQQSSETNHDQYFNQYIDNKIALSFFIINKDGINEYSTDKDVTNELNPIYTNAYNKFQEALLGRNVFIAPIKYKDQSKLFFVTKLKDNRLLAMGLNPYQEFTRIHYLGRLGQTGESYSINEQGYILSDSRFTDELYDQELLNKGENSILNLRVVVPDSKRNDFTHMTKNLLKKKDGINLDGYIDYRGQKVVGAWSWISSLNLGMVTEVDQNEIMSSYELTKIVLITITIISILTPLLFSVVVLYLFNKSTQKIMEVNDNLEQRVKLRTKELSVAKKDAEQANEAKSIFLANMSHEIRTPMNSILGFTDVLISKTNDEKHLHYLKIILMSGKSLLSLINDILDISKIEAGKYHLEIIPTDLNALITYLQESFSKRIEDKNLEFEIIKEGEDIPDYVQLDPNRLKQILINLVGNAIKFTDEGKITLKLNIVREINQKTYSIFFSVTDTGIGIAEDDLSSIFEAFEQQKGQSNEKYGGTGLGLSISKKLIELMDGTLSVSSKKGEGATFTVSLSNVIESDPILIQEHIPSDENKEALTIAGLTILIVDDIQRNIDLLSAYFEEDNVNLLIAKNGQEGVDIAKEELPDIILMDMRMPVMNGIDASKILKAHQDTEDIPIIAISASSTTSEQEELMAITDYYLSKPVEKNKLYKVINKLTTEELEGVNNG